MNLVDLFLIVLIALTVFVGIKRGLLISLLSALRFIPLISPSEQNLRSPAGSVP